MARSPQMPSGRNGEPTEQMPEASESQEQPAGSWSRDTPTSGKHGTLSTQEHKDLLASLRKAQRPSSDSPSPSRAAQLQTESEELRNAVAQMQQRLEDATAPSKGSWEDREREFESILEEKSEEIRLLYMQIQERERKSNDDAKPARGEARGNDEEINALADELAQDQARLEEEREQVRVERDQIRADEEDLERRMQEMELQTAKSRADLVRQRNELQRLYNEVRAELEQAKQGGAVSDRVRNLERAAQELSQAGRTR